MPRDMFGDVVHPASGLGARPRSAASASLIGHALFAAIVIIVPLMAADQLPSASPPDEVIRVSVEPDPPPLPVGRRSPTTQPPQQASLVSSPAPIRAPSEIAPEAERTTSIGAPVGPPGDLPEAGIGTVGAAPVAPETPPATPVPTPVRPGGVIKTPTKVRHVPPIYPAIAQQARVEGVVIIEAVIGVDGRVKEAQILRSKPLLDDAALEAVRQWEFTPTTLNGVPVPVIMTVTVNFTLG